MLHNVLSWFSLFSTLTLSADHQRCVHALVSIIGCNEILSHPLFLAHTHTACPPGLYQYHPRSHPPAGYLLPHSHLPWRGELKYLLFVVTESGSWSFHLFPFLSSLTFLLVTDHRSLEETGLPDDAWPWKLQTAPPGTHWWCTGKCTMMINYSRWQFTKVDQSHDLYESKITVFM